MSKSPSSTKSPASDGFKSFWKQSKSSTPEDKTIEFVQQDPSVKTKAGRLSRLLGSSQRNQTLAQKSSQKRREQVYEAQKRHRNRKADYVKSLEAEIAHLQHLDAVANSERNALLLENQAIKALLAARSIAAPTPTYSLPTPPLSTQPSNPWTASIDIRFDDEIGHERTFMDFSWDDSPIYSDQTHTISDVASEVPQPTPPAESTELVKGDSWAALDFILALEWPCQGHIYHDGINPEAQIPVACQQGGFHGHALTATAAVYSSALAPANTTTIDGDHAVHSSPTQNYTVAGTDAHWHLPHSEIDKLVALSEQLDLDDELMTPAQAYSAIRRNLTSDEHLRPTLNALKKPLAALTECRGFGTVLRADQFWAILATQLPSITIPDLPLFDDDVVS